jgi:hypothetical protein
MTTRERKLAKAGKLRGGAGKREDDAEDPPAMKLRVISLGWGRQSFTLAAMVALGELPPSDYAIHADTRHEAAGTYAFAEKWTPWLRERGVKVVTVQADNTDPVREDWSNSVMIPAFTRDGTTGSDGQIRRQCTHDWKVMPMRRFIRSVIPNPKPGDVESWQGITYDEIERIKTSDVAYIVNQYPLVDRRMTRLDCVSWLNAHGLEVPPKSSCTFCPFHSLNQWQELKRAAGPDWDEAQAVDAEIREQRPPSAIYVHPARRPLAEAVLIPEDLGAKPRDLRRGALRRLAFGPDKNLPRLLGWVRDLRLRPVMVEPAT